MVHVVCVYTANINQYCMLLHDHFTLVNILIDSQQNDTASGSSERDDILEQRVNG